MILISLRLEDHHLKYFRSFVVVGNGARGYIHVFSFVTVASEVSGVSYCSRLEFVGSVEFLRTY